MPQLGIALLAFVFLVVPCRRAAASTITYDFTGVIGESTYPGISVGAPVTGSVIYDPDAPVDVFAPGNFIGFFPTLSSLTATVGGTLFLSTVVSEGAENDISVSTFLGVPAAVYDLFVIEGVHPGLFVDLDFFDADATFFDSLPGLPPVLPLSSFEYTLLVVRGREGVAMGHVALTPAAPVPEPTSLVLLGTGLAALVRRRRS